MTQSVLSIPVIYSTDTSISSLQVIEDLQQLVRGNQLPLQLEGQNTPQKFSQKNIRAFSDAYQQPILMIDAKQTLTLVMDGISAAPQWQSLQRRVVRAGRKTELILQACKPANDSHVLDATAGFGHDSLILASTGARVTLLEQNPVMALLLLNEQVKMAQNKNWQKLTARLDIHCAEASAYLSQITQQSTKASYDVVYLDPMFPQDSYEDSNTGKGAKVGKHMQVLHQVAHPPTAAEEANLLRQSKQALVEGGRVIVKRPITAPIFATTAADESWQNDVVRFDGYFN